MEIQPVYIAMDEIVQIINEVMKFKASMTDPSPLPPSHWLDIAMSGNIGFPIIAILKAKRELKQAELEWDYYLNEQ